MEKIKFYDLKTHQPFYSDNYEIKIKGKAKIAYAKSPSGKISTRIIERA